MKKQYTIFLILILTSVYSFEGPLQLNDSDFYVEFHEDNRLTISKEMSGEYHPVEGLDRISLEDLEGLKITQKQDFFKKESIPKSVFTTGAVIGIYSSFAILPAIAVSTAFVVGLPVIERSRLKENLYLGNKFACGYGMSYDTEVKLDNQIISSLLSAKEDITQLSDSLEGFNNNNIKCMIYRLAKKGQGKEEDLFFLGFNSREENVGQNDPYDPSSRQVAQNDEDSDETSIEYVNPVEVKAI